MRYLLLRVHVLVVALLAGCTSHTSGTPGTPAPADLSRFEYAQVHMGVKVRLVLYAASQSAADAAAEAAYARIASLDGILSDWRVDSELNRLCAKAGGGPVPVSMDLFRVLRRAQTISMQTDGAFDVTVGPLVALWRQARRTGRLPTPQQLAEARARVGWEKMRLGEAASTVELTVPGMKLDLGGIAKGYVGDCTLAELRQRKVTIAMYEAGGDIVVGDAPPGTRGWSIEVPDLPEGTRRFTLVNGAISTSGDTEQFVELAGQRYSHVVDPRTGLGLTDRWMATVIAPDGMFADALATAATVLGPEKTAELLRICPAGTRAIVRKAPG